MNINEWFGSAPKEELLEERQKVIDQQLWANDRLILIDAALRQMGAALRSRPLPQAPPEVGIPLASAVSPQEDGEPKPECYLNLEIFDDTCPETCVGFKGCKAKLKRELAKE